jgi:hypothetical protein
VEDLPVAAIEPNRALVLDMRNMGGFDWVWQFGLYPVDEQRTQLVSRSCVRTRFARSNVRPRDTSAGPVGGAATWCVEERAVEAAMAKAQELAGDRVVEVAAGHVGGQVPAAGLIDEVRMDVVPVVFG